MLKYVEHALLVTVKPEAYRVLDLSLARRNKLPATERVTAVIEPLQSLKTLPLDQGEVTSLYYNAWPLRGHVKGAIKPWESLLLSLVSLDLFVGMDKEYGNTALTGNPFYTSLLPWNRQASDMNDFSQFLRFQGWNL